jgi:hypothetical protein
MDVILRLSCLLAGALIGFRERVETLKILDGHTNSCVVRAMGGVRGWLLGEQRAFVVVGRVRVAAELQCCVVGG